MTGKCPNCHKDFTILYPQMWAYKRSSEYFCSWKCLRAVEKENEGVKEVSGKTKVPVEAKQNAIQAAIDGKDPYEYLRPYTSNPKAMWTYIKTMVKQKDPELYAQLPDLRDRKKPKQEEPKQTLADAVTGMKEAADEFFGACEEMGVKTDPPEEPKICQPIVYDDMTIREVEGLFGRYRRSDVGDAVYIDLEFTDCCDVISNTVGQWRSFIDELNKAAKILGVEI